MKVKSTKPLMYYPELSWEKYGLLALIGLHYDGIELKSIYLNSKESNEYVDNLIKELLNDGFLAICE